MTDRKYCWFYESREIVASEEELIRIFEDAGLITEEEFFGKKIRVGSNLLRTISSEMQYKK